MVVIIYNMRREATRTLYSLSENYQRGIMPRDYEVIVIDNGSVPPFPAEDVTEQAGTFVYFYIDKARLSPARAVNFGVRQSRGKYVGIMRSEEHTSELQSLRHLVCRLLLEKQKNKQS